MFEIVCRPKARIDLAQDSPGMCLAPPLVWLWPHFSEHTLTKAFWQTTCGQSTSSFPSTRTCCGFLDF